MQRIYQGVNKCKEMKKQIKLEKNVRKEGNTLAFDVFFLLLTQRCKCVRTIVE
jgi:hypothetical protein